MDSITFIIPTYNNLRYLKRAYDSIQLFAPDHKIIILDDNSNDGTDRWVNRISDYDDLFDNVIYWKNSGPRLGHTILYNVGVQLSTTPVFTILHADMFIGPNYVENLLKHLKPGTVVSATRVEPPLHPPGNEKIIKDFGLWPEEMDVKKFVSFVEEEQLVSFDKTTRGIFAPWMMYKEDYENIGGHDPLFAPFPYEDSDIFQRMILNGYDIIQSRDALVYHLTCRGHKWTDDKELGKVDNFFRTSELNARRNWFRKWGTWIENDAYSYPKIYPKLRKGLIATGLTRQQLWELEPCFDYIKLEDVEYDDVLDYITTEQSSTFYNLEIKFNLPVEKADVIVKLDGKDFGSSELKSVYDLPKILKGMVDSGHNVMGEYSLGPLEITVKDWNPVERENIINEKYELHTSIGSKS